MIGAGILSLAIIAQAGLWTYYADDRTFSKMSILFVWPAALFALAIWWTFLSGQTWNVRLGVWGAIGLACATFVGIFAFDGVDGEMMPRFRYRWKPSSAQLAAEYFANRPTVPSPIPDSTRDDAVEMEPLTAGDDDWPGFRGPHRDGIVTGVTLRRDWDRQPPKELWRHPVGLGWSGFAIVGDFAFTQEQRGPNECVVCYRLDDGTEIWAHEDPTRLEIVDLNGGDGPHATPQFADGRLYTLGGTGLLNCLDARNGDSEWQTDILKDAGKDGLPVVNIQWGMSGTPLIVGNLVIVSPGGGDEDPEAAKNPGRSTIAYDRTGGHIVWANGNYPAGYASPQFAVIHDVPQVIVFHGTGIAGHDLTDGRVLWNYAWRNGPKVNAAQPLVFDDGSILFGCGYGMGSARVDLNVSAEDQWKTKLRWETHRFRPKFNDFVPKDGYIYGLDDGILTCIDVKSGKSKWKNGRFGYGQLLLVGDVLLILTEQGELVQVEAVPEKYSEVTRFLALEETCWNHLAIAHGKLLIRNNHFAACFAIP